MITALIILIAGCSSKRAEPITKNIIVDNVVEQYVPTKCEVPKVRCYIDKNATYTSKIHAIDDCVEDLYQANGVYR